MGAYVYLPPEWSWGAPKIKYYDVLKWENRFTLGFNTAKNTGYMKKASNKSCCELNFVQKTQWAHMSISHKSGARGSKDCHI